MASPSTLPCSLQSKENVKKLYEEERDTFPLYRRTSYLDAIRNSKMVPPLLKEELTFIIDKNMKIIHEFASYTYPICLKQPDEFHYALFFVLTIPLEMKLTDPGRMIDFKTMLFDDLYSYLYDTKQLEVNPEVLYPYVVSYEGRVLYTGVVTVQEVEELKKSKDPDIVRNINRAREASIKKDSVICIKCYKRFNKDDVVKISCSCRAVLCKKHFSDYVKECKVCISQNNLCEDHMIIHATECGQKCSNPKCEKFKNKLEERSEKLKNCSRCKKVSYCNVECQATHWKLSHGRECVPIAPKQEKKTSKIPKKKEDDKVKEEQKKEDDKVKEEQKKEDDKVKENSKEGLKEEEVKDVSKIPKEEIMDKEEPKVTAKDELKKEVKEEPKKEDKQKESMLVEEVDY